MIFRLRDYIFYPLAIKRQYQFLQESQYWSPQKRKAYIQERLEKTLTYAVKYVPYYQRTLNPFRSHFTEMIERLDLTELPLLTKDNIRNHYQELISQHPQHQSARESHTSGSTGSPMKFLLDKNSDISQFAAIWRVLAWSGYKLGNKYGSILTSLEKETKREVFYDVKQNCLNLVFTNLKKDKIKKYVALLNFFNPTIIKSYPSAFALLAHWLEETNIVYRPQAILTCAETLLDHQREKIQQILQCPIYDFYNQNERACLFSTCGHGKYHIHEEYSFVELLANDTKSQPGVQAEIIATTFDNFAMPLIRYQTQDLAVIDKKEACQCGRTYQTVANLIGRADDVILTPEGLQATRMDNIFKYSPGVQEAQIVQKQIDHIHVNIVKSVNFNQQDFENLSYRLKLRLGDNMKIDFNYVDTIPLNKNGKKKFIVSAINKADITCVE